MTHARFDPSGASGEGRDRAEHASDLSIPPPSGLEVATLEWYGEPRIVISFPLPKPRWPRGLTRAERAVAALLIDGLTNGQIASRRGTSERTVVNQVAAIYKKAGVASRAELTAHVFGA